MNPWLVLLGESYEPPFEPKGDVCMDRRKPHWMISTFSLGTSESEIQVKKQREQRAVLLSEFLYRHERGKIFPFLVFWRMEAPVSTQGKVPLKWDASS